MTYDEQPSREHQKMLPNSVPINSTGTMIRTLTIYNINGYKKINPYLLKNNQQNTTNFIRSVDIVSSGIPIDAIIRVADVTLTIKTIVTLNH